MCDVVVLSSRFPLGARIGHRQVESPAEDHRKLPTTKAPLGGPPRTHLDGLGGRVPSAEFRGQTSPHTAGPGRRTPSPELAFRRAAFTPVAPESVFSPPPALLDALDDAERVMVVSHVPPDGDCVGTALGVARALKRLGKEACAVVDSALPRGLAGLDDAADLLRAADAADFEADLVLLVDVAQPDRIGGAKAFLEAAPAIAVIDHHRADPTPERLGVAADTPVNAWVDEHADSASLMAAAAMRTLAARRGVDATGWDEVTGPLAAGAATDTSWFSKASTRPTSLPIFKHLLGGSTRRLRALRGQLTYELPAAARRLLDREVDLHVCSHHGHSAAWMSANHATLQDALRLAREVDPAVTPDDVSGALLDRLDRVVRHHEVAVLLLEEPGGSVRLSTRSRDPEAAGEVARALGGGGKHGAGGAVLEDSTLEGSRAAAEQVLDTWVLGQLSTLRLRGSA